MSLHPLTNHLSSYADTSSTQKDGRAKASAQLMRDLYEPDTQVRVVPKTLGEILGYLPLVVDSDLILDTLSEPDPSGNPSIPKLEDVYLLLERAIKGAIKQQHGIDEEDYSLDDISGKSENGWLRSARSVEFDIVDQLWRLGDFLRPKVVLMARIALGQLRLHPKKEVLGDGIVGVISPELAGLPIGTTDFMQVRALVRADDGRITRIFKGLVMVHPDAKNVWAWQDGYGRTEREGSLEIYEMVRGSVYKPRSRYTVQGLYYQGVANWPDYLFTQENVLRQVDDDCRIVEERLIAANSPVRMLGGQGLHMLMGRLSHLSVYGGRARMGLPAKAFEFIAGLEHIAQSEHHQRLFDNDIAFDSETSQGHARLPYFFAPQHFRPYFEASGGLRSQWVINRLPDLSTGQCVIRHELVGYQPFNAFVIPSWSMKLAGNDFDGDTLKVVPPTERGGLYVAFNDLPLEEQRKRLKKATTDRSAAKGKHLYPNGLWRWAGQLEAARILGASDLTSRRFIDMGLREEAYRLQPWTQCSVDRQKRPVPWPHPKGPERMPTVPKAKTDLFVTDLLRDITKADGRGARGYEAAWRAFETRMEALDTLARNGYLSGFGNIYSYGGDRTLKLLSHWATHLFERMNQALALIPKNPRYPHGRQLPHVIDYPNRTPADELPEVPARLISAIDYLDQRWDEAYGAGGSTRQGLFNVKDALVDIAQHLKLSGALAEYARTFRIFRIFATVPQLKAYCDQQRGVRISDLFPHYEHEEVFELAMQGQALMLRNNRPIYVGMSQFPTGKLALELRVAHEQRHFVWHRSDGSQLTLRVTDLNEALLQVRARVNEEYLAALPAAA
jgi:hypothetical protein